MSQYFPAGSRATWKGDWNDIGWFNSPVTQVSEVSSYLEANCNMSVESSSVTEPEVFSTSSTRTVTLKVRTLIDRNDVYDLDADIRHAFYVVMNQEPDASTITNFTMAGGSTQPTGAPDPTADNGETPKDPNDNSPSWWDGLKTSLGLDKLGAGLIGVGVGAVAVVGILIFVVIKEEV